MALTPAQKKAEAAKEDETKATAPAKDETAKEDTKAATPAKEESKAPAKDEAAKEEAKAPAKEATKSKTIKVLNPHPRFHYTHPASGTRLGAGETKELVRDSWLEMQCKAGVLKEV